MNFRIIPLLLCLVQAGNVAAQLFEPDEGFHAADSLIGHAGFSMHKDTYFITGIPLNEQPSRSNSDVKYQVSFKQRLKKEPLPGGIIPYLLYSQKAFWNIYENSKPFSEINFNPGFAVVRPFYLKGKRLTYATLSLEHESNGRDSIYSRSWNFLALSLKSRLSDRWTVGVRSWIPFPDKTDNPDLIKYVGYGELSASYEIISRRLTADMLFRKGSGVIDYGSLQTQLSWRPFKKEDYLIMLQLFQGYGESLIDYRVKTSMLRLGFVLKTSSMGIF